MVAIGAHLLATIKTIDGASLSYRLKILRDGLKKLQKETETCPNYCNKYYSQCDKFAKFSLERNICIKAIIICHFGCTGKGDDSKRKLLVEMSQLIPKKQKTSKTQLTGKEKTLTIKS